ncbi:FAD binding domain-containing protein [Ditylenchus destructor]|nr:FAD binding domain-containing protein [Ditylenchus destructor]
MLQSRALKLQYFGLLCKSPATALRRLSTFIGGHERKCFAQISDKDLQFFESILGRQNVKTNDLDEYNVDFMKWYKGSSACVLTPENEAQISAILSRCNHENLAVVPQAGNTGLVGGSVPVHDEIVVSLKKLNKEYSLEAAAGILQCDAGFVLEELDAKVGDENYMMPIDLGAKGSCLIGGCVATNAGGIRLIRYGSLHANILALNVVIPDDKGTILRLGSSLRKDNADLHLKNLFIGSEGQLGIITRVAMLVAPRPASVHSAFLGTGSFHKCCEILRTAKQMLGEILSSFELMDSDTLSCIKQNTGMDNVIATNPAFNLLIETSGSNSEHDSAKMEKFLNHCIDDGLAEDGIMAESIADANYMWKLRENASLSLISDGYVYKFDLSLPLAHFYEIVEVIRKRLGDRVTRVVGFGHVGDGNVHLNITAPSHSKEVYDILYPFIYEWVSTHGGSISAEHGIGRLKREDHRRFTSEKKLEINAAVKKVFDPRGILSPYKLIDAS